MNYSGCEGLVTVFGQAVIELTGFTVEQSTNALDASKMDGTCNRSVKKGKTSWSGNVDIFYDPDELWRDDLKNGLVVGLTMYPEVSKNLSGNALISNISTPIEIDGMITQSFTYEGIGELDTGGIDTTGFLIDSTTLDFLVDSTTSDNLTES